MEQMVPQKEWERFVDRGISKLGKLTEKAGVGMQNATAGGEHKEDGKAENAPKPEKADEGRSLSKVLGQTDSKW